jgi:hypothetical protein
VRWGTLATRGAAADAAETEEPAAAAKTEAAKSPRRTLSPAWLGLIALVIYVAVFIVAFGQSLVVNLHQPAVGQGEVDPNFYIWAWRWWTYAVSHWTNPLYSYQIGAPAGYNLAWATTSPTVALLVAPITATLGPLVSFNLTLLLAPPTAAWGAFVVARRITGRFWASLPGGAVFGFNVYMLDHSISGQPNLTVTVLLPLIAYLVVRWWQGAIGRTGYVIWMAVALALEFYTFVEAFADLTLLWVFGLLVALAVVGRGQRGTVIRLARQTIVAYVGAMVLAAPYLWYAFQHYPVELTRQMPQFSLDIGSLVLPRTDHLLWMRWWAAAAAHVIAATAYVGLLLLLVLVLLAVFNWSNRLVRLLMVGFVVIVLLATGPNLIIDGQQAFTWPWGGMWNWPILKSAEPVRLIDFGYLVLAVALAVWLAEVTRSALVRAGRWALGLLALTGIFANLPTFAEVVNPPARLHWTQAMPSLGVPPNALPSFFADGAYQQYVKPGEIVVIVSRRGNAGMLFQATTDYYFRIAGGFINASLSAVSAIPNPVQDMNDPTAYNLESFEEYIRSAGVGAIIVEQAWSEAWMYNFGLAGLKPVSVGGVTVFNTSTLNKEVPGYPPALFPGMGISGSRPDLEP